MERPHGGQRAGGILFPVYARASETEKDARTHASMYFISCLNRTHANTEQMASSFSSVHFWLHFEGKVANLALNAPLTVYRNYAVEAVAPVVHRKTKTLNDKTIFICFDQCYNQCLRIISENLNKIAKFHLNLKRF